MSCTSDSITAAKSQITAIVPWLLMNLMPMGSFKAVVLRKQQASNQKE